MSIDVKVEDGELIAAKSSNPKYPGVDIEFVADNDTKKENIMSRNMELRSILVEVKPGNRKDLLDALCSLSDCDCDFNGENGLEYLWDEVWEANGYKNHDDFADKHPDIEEEVELKYESNMDYLCDKVKDIESDESCINEFIENWIGRDGYYGEYELNWLTNNDGKIIVLSLAYMCG